MDESISSESIAQKIDRTITNGLGYSGETFGLGYAQDIDFLHTTKEGLDAHLAALEEKTGWPSLSFRVRKTTTIHLFENGNAPPFYVAFFDRVELENHEASELRNYVRSNGIAERARQIALGVLADKRYNEYVKHLGLIIEQTKVVDLSRLIEKYEPLIPRKDEFDFGRRLKLKDNYPISTLEEFLREKNKFPRTPRDDDLSWRPKYNEIKMLTKFPEPLFRLDLGRYSKDDDPFRIRDSIPIKSSKFKFPEPPLGSEPFISDESMRRIAELLKIQYPKHHWMSHQKPFDKDI